jgi:simple sugar transport system permease protein
MLTGGVGNMIGTFFGVLSLALIQSIVSSFGLDQAWWTGITVAAMLCLFLIVQSVIVARRKRGSKQQNGSAGKGA